MELGTGKHGIFTIVTEHRTYAKYPDIAFCRGNPLVVALSVVSLRKSYEQSKVLFVRYAVPINRQSDRLLDPLMDYY